MCRGFVDRFEWQPTSCTLPQWNAKRFCAVLGGRRVLFVGDSTVEQVAGVLQAQVQWDHWNTRSRSCASQIALASSDTLVKRDFGRFNRGWQWRAVLIVRQARWVVVTSPNTCGLSYSTAMTVERIGLSASCYCRVGQSVRSRRCTTAAY